MDGLRFSCLGIMYVRNDASKMEIQYNYCHEIEMSGTSVSRPACNRILAQWQSRGYPFWVFKF